jgi:hypothetical protein
VHFVSRNAPQELLIGLAMHMSVSNFYTDIMYLALVLRQRKALFKSSFSASHNLAIEIVFLWCVFLYVVKVLDI